MIDFSIPPVGYELVFQDDWSGYEDSAWVYVYEKDGKYYCIEGGYSCMAEENYEETWDDMHEVPEEYVYEIMEQWNAMDRDMF